MIWIWSSCEWGGDVGDLEWEITWISSDLEE